MIARKPVLAMLGLLLLSGLAVVAYAAITQAYYLPLQGLPDPAHASSPAGRFSILNFTELPGRKQNGRSVPARVVVIKRVDALSPELQQAAQKTQVFPTAVFATYQVGPGTARRLTEKVTLTKAKLIDDHTFTDATKYGSKPVESMTFTYASLDSMDYPDVPKPTNGKPNTTLQ